MRASSLTRGVSLRTRDTVPTPTFAWRATSRIVGAWLPRLVGTGSIASQPTVTLTLGASTNARKHLTMFRYGETLDPVLEERILPVPGTGNGCPQHAQMTTGDRRIAVAGEALLDL